MLIIGKLFGMIWFIKSCYLGILFKEIELNE